MSKKLLLIGWDAADWKTIDRLMDQGDMPLMKGLVERGTRGNLTTLHPVLSPMLWTSIATGKRPFKHGIHGFAEPDPAGGARAISNLGRSTKAVWSILKQNGLRSNVIGWWPSHPVEPINGVMDLEEWDFMAVYHDAIDHFGHGFMKYHHPRQDWIPERDFELYSNIIDMGYRFHDLMLGQTLSKIDLNQTTVVICSDHGFHPDHLRPRAIPKEPAGPAVEHREHGVFLIAGPGIKRDALVHGATLLDVTPTVLTLFGLPVGEDMDGEPLTECFEPQGEQLPEVQWVESWDAIDLLERLWSDWPMEHRFGVRLAYCAQMLGQTGFQRQIAEALAVLAKAEQASPKSVRLLTLIGRVYLEMKRPEDAEQSFQKVIGFDPLHPDAHLGLTRVALARGQFQRAARLGLKTVGLRYHFPWAHHYLGVALEGLKRYRQAAQAFEVAVSQNPNLLEAHRRLEHLYSHVLGGSPAARAKAEEHTRAIAEIGSRIEARRARRAGAVPQVDGGADVKPVELDDPNAPKPDDPVLAQAPCEIVVVSGLPRSGTSMMMQMLEAGGIAPLTDVERTADGDNPKGYYEYEPAKRLMTDRTWLPEADGKAVKVIAQLLPYLPPKPHQFRVIFMERDLGEVAASQARMLENLDKQGARLPEDKLKHAYAQQIAALKRCWASTAASPGYGWRMPTYSPSLRRWRGAWRCSWGGTWTSRPWPRWWTRAYIGSGATLWRRPTDRNSDRPAREGGVGTAPADRSAAERSVLHLG